MLLIYKFATEECFSGKVTPIWVKVSMKFYKYTLTLYEHILRLCKTLIIHKNRMSYTGLQILGCCVKSANLHKRLHSRLGRVYSKIVVKNVADERTVEFARDTFVQ